MKPSLRRRPGRPAHASSTESRDAILTAARTLFARRGFRGTTFRLLAKRLSVNVQLVRYYFGSKAGLFSAVIKSRLAETASARIEDGPGERMLRFSLDKTLVERQQAVTALIRTVLGDPGVFPKSRELFHDLLVTGADLKREPASELLTELAGAMVLGLFICREMVGVEPLASTPIDRIVSLVAPSLDELLRR